jgi:tRNA dimethylallyltransferase
MMKDGLLEEAKQFFSRRHLNALQTVGYQELFDYLSGKVTLEKAVELIKRNTRHYAKRQLTWFKKYFVDENTEVLKRVDANIQFPI